MSKALIGITPFQEPVENQPSKQVLSAYYSNAVSRAGGIPIIIPVNLPKSDLTALVDQLDGIIEAFEMPGHPFGLGVQWHPENLLDSPQASALFEALTAAARSEA